MFESALPSVICTGIGKPVVTRTARHYLAYFEAVIRRSRCRHKANRNLSLLGFPIKKPKKPCQHAARDDAGGEVFHKRQPECGD